jgi:DNA polymerase-3 subunit beta
MKITCLQENLKRGLVQVAKAVSGKSTLPVLSNVLLATDGGRLKLAATNLEWAITSWIGGEVLVEGAVTIPAKLLIDVVNGLPNDKMTLTLNERTQTIEVKCVRFTTNIKGIESKEFPEIPTVPADAASASLPSDVLREAIDQVAFAAATTDGRPVLTAVALTIQGEQLSLAASDGFRLALRTIKLPAAVAGTQVYLIPARALDELAFILGSSEGAVTLAGTPGGGHVVFRGGSCELMTRQVDGKFPDVNRVIPATHDTRAVVDTTALSKAVKLASYFASASQNVVKLNFEPGSELAPGRMVLSANAAEVGDNTGEVDGTIEGAGGQIALNVKLLGEALASIKTPKVIIDIQGPAAPGVLSPCGQDVAGSHVHVIMPLSIKG